MLNSFGFHLRKVRKRLLRHIRVEVPVYWAGFTMTSDGLNTNQRLSSVVCITVISVQIDILPLHGVA
jgi:hypothetical protein